MSDLATRRRWGPEPRYPRVREYREEREPGLIVLAGPCSVESLSQAMACADAARDAGASYLRGGVYRAGTYPGEVFGFQPAALEHMTRAGLEYCLPLVLEVLDVRTLEGIDRQAGAFQVGARHMQDYALLKELAAQPKPVFLKNGKGDKLDEILGACEYLARGRCKPRIIVRGSSSIHDHVRWELSVSLIPAIKKLTGVPVLVDASHGTGRADLVEPMTMAGVAAGADGLLVEMHPDPGNSISDADQAVSLEAGKEIVRKARALHAGAKGGWCA